MDYGLALQQMYPSIDKSQYELMMDVDGNFIISRWNPTDTPKPTISDITNFWNTGMMPYFREQKKSQLQQSFQNSLLNGFTSNADGTSRIYAIDPVSMGKWTGALAVINIGNSTSTMTVKDFSGNKVNLTPSQFQQMAADGFTFYSTQESHLWDLEDKVDNAQTQPDLDAIAW